MASRKGPTVDGTDGTDFMHREKVATQYKLRWVGKYLLKHWLMVERIEMLKILFFLWRQCRKQIQTEDMHFFPHPVILCHVH